MTTTRIRATLPLLLRLGLGLMFIVAGSLKLGDVNAFVAQVANYHLFPAWSAYVGAIVPALEWVVGAAIIVSPRLWRQAAEWLLLAMLIGFTLAVCRAWWLGIDVECGCFGTGSTPIGPWVVARNVALIAATGVLLALEMQQAKSTARAVKPG